MQFMLSVNYNLQNIKILSRKHIEKFRREMKAVTKPLAFISRLQFYFTMFQYF